jgi:hypothetical protein
MQEKQVFHEKTPLETALAFALQNSGYPFVEGRFIITDVIGDFLQRTTPSVSAKRTPPPADAMGEIYQAVMGLTGRMNWDRKYLWNVRTENASFVVTYTVYPTPANLQTFRHAPSATYHSLYNEIITSRSFASEEVVIIDTDLQQRTEREHHANTRALWRENLARIRAGREIIVDKTDATSIAQGNTEPAYHVMRMRFYPGSTPEKVELYPAASPLLLGFADPIRDAERIASTITGELVWMLG